MRLAIAGLLIDIIPDHNCLCTSLERFEKFIVPFSTTPADIAITLIPQRNIEMPADGIVHPKEADKWIIHGSESYACTVFRCSRRAPNSEPIFIVDVTDKWRRIKLTFLEDNPNVAEEVAIIIGNIIMKCRLAFVDGLILHASAVLWDGKCILFTGPSGTGKSTHARNWCECRRARIINDDSPVVRMVNEKAVVFGTPWSGSKLIFENESAPLSAIVVLEQAAENGISLLGLDKAISKILPRSFLPYHDRRLLDMHSATFSRIVETTPLYNLKCRPDEEAVQIVAECLG